MNHYFSKDILLDVLLDGDFSKEAMTIGSVKRQGPFNFELQRNCDLRSGKI
jgi:hypothetical protein